MSSRAFASGPYFGHFAYAYDPAVRTPTELSLERTGDRLAGRGKDQDGAYEILGGVEGDEVRFTKSYTRGPGKGTRVAYLGTWGGDRGEVVGRWRIVDCETHGTFALRPGTAETLAEQTDASQTRDALLRNMRRFEKKIRADVERLRFDGETAMLDTLLADPDFVKTAMQAHATQAVGEETPDAVAMMPPRTRLSRAMLPDAFLALDRCKKTLGLTAPVDLHCQNDGSLNAFVVTTPDGRIDITLTSGVLNNLDVDELCYVIGHEIGHAVLGHIEARVGHDAEMSGQARLRRLALFRYQELSADRVGLLCCVDVDKAVRAEFMLHTGVVVRDRIGSSRAIVAGAEKAIARGEGKARDAEDGYDTHPCGAFRTLAIGWFGASNTFAALTGKKPAGVTLTDEELEKRVQSLVEVMNPSIMNATSSDAELAEFVALTALAVARADKTASKKELTAIRDLGPAIAEALVAAEKMTFEAQQLRTLDLAEKLRMTLRPAVSQRVIEDLTMIAQVDGKVTPEEALVLDTCAVLLDCAGAPTDLLAELGAGLD